MSNQMNQQQLFALLSHSVCGRNIRDNREAIDGELYALGLLSWVFATHATPGFYEISDHGKDALSSVLAHCAAI